MSGGPGDDAGRRRGRSRWLVVWVIASLTVIAASFTAGMFVRSPWDQASANATANPIVTATVRSYDFTPERPLLHGTIALGRLTDVQIPVADGAAVVTRVFRRAGQEVRSGDPLIEVSGRPLLALEIPFPLYRTITPGAEGADVLAVQQALTALGRYPSSAVDGVYGPATSRAIDALYAASHLKPPPPSASLVSAARAAEKALANTAASPGSKRYAELARARDEAVAAAATPLPSTEVAAVTGGRLAIVKTLPMGAVLDGGANASIRLRGGAPTASARVSVKDKDAFAAGAEVLLRNESGDRLDGVVSGLSEFRDDDPAGYDVRVRIKGKTSGWTDKDRITLTPSRAPARESGMGVPLTAIRDDPNGTFVWVRSNTGEVKRTAVTLGTERAGVVRIVGGGLSAGDQVVVAGR